MSKAKQPSIDWERMTLLRCVASQQKCKRPKTNKIHRYNWNHWTVNTVSIKPLWTVNESGQVSRLFVVQLKSLKKIISFNCLFISPLWRDIFQLSPHSIQTNRTVKALILHIFKYNLINHKATIGKAIRFNVNHAWISIKLVLWMILRFHNTSLLDQMNFCVHGKNIEKPIPSEIRLC